MGSAFAGVANAKAAARNAAERKRPYLASRLCMAVQPYLLWRTTDARNEQRFDYPHADYRRAGQRVKRFDGQIGNDAASRSPLYAYATVVAGRRRNPVGPAG